MHIDPEKFISKDKKVICGLCNNELYNFNGIVKIGEVVNAKDFDPIGISYKPVDGRKICCAFCKAEYSCLKQKWFHPK